MRARSRTNEEIYEDVRSGKTKVRRHSHPLIRFWGNVNKYGPIHPMLGQCWQWMGGTADFGHGMLFVTVRREYAHRYSWLIHGNEIPSGLCVLHSCDNPGCVNPEHLFLGTRMDNNKDRHSKGRSGDHKGTANGRAVLDEEKVLELRAKYRKVGNWSNAKQLIDEYGISITTLGKVLRRESWSHV